MLKSKKGAMGFVILLIGVVILLGWYLSSHKTNEITSTLNQTACSNAGGSWTTCGSKCVIDHQGQNGVACPMICEELCECGGFMGLKCPDGSSCKMPVNITDAMGYCKP